MQGDRSAGDFVSCRGLRVLLFCYCRVRFARAPLRLARMEAKIVELAGRYSSLSNGPIQLVWRVRKIRQLVSDSPSARGGWGLPKIVMMYELTR